MSRDRPRQSAAAHRDDPAPLQPHGDQPPYRDDTQAVRQELARLRRPLVTAIEAMRATAGPVYVARRARVVAASVLVGCSLLLLAGIVGQRVFAMEHLVITLVLLVSWPAAGLAFVLARVWAPRDFARRMRAPIRETGDAHADLERLRRYDPGQHATRLLSETEAVSFGPLLAGAGSLLPMTLHFIGDQILYFIYFISAPTLRPHLDLRPWLDYVRHFDGWIWLSLQMTAQCHVLLAMRAWQDGKHLATVPTGSLLQHGRERGWKIYRHVWCSAFFPAMAFTLHLGGFAEAVRVTLQEMAVALVGNVIVVGITGLFIPPLYRRAARRLVAERTALATTMPQPLEVSET